MVNSGALAREARRGAPWVRKSGKLPIFNDSEYVVNSSENVAFVTGFLREYGIL